MSSVKDEQQSSNDSWSLSDSWDTDSWDDKESMGSITEFLNTGEKDEDEILTPTTESIQNTFSQRPEGFLKSNVLPENTNSDTERTSAYVKTWVASTQHEVQFGSNETSPELTQTFQSDDSKEMTYQNTKMSSQTSLTDTAIDSKKKISQDAFEITSTRTQNSVGKRKFSPGAVSEASTDSHQKRSCSKNNGPPSPDLLNVDKVAEDTLESESDSQSLIRKSDGPNTCPSNSSRLKSLKREHALESIPTQLGIDSSPDDFDESQLIYNRTVITPREFSLYIEEIANLLRDYSVPAIYQSVCKDDWNYDNKIDCSRTINLYKIIMEKGVKSGSVPENRKGSSMKSHFKIQVREKNFLDDFKSQTQFSALTDEVRTKMCELLTTFKHVSRTPSKSHIASPRSSASNTPTKLTFTRREEANLLVAIMDALEEDVPEKDLKIILTSDAEKTWNEIIVKEKPLLERIREMSGSEKLRAVQSYRTKVRAWRETPVKLDSLRIFLEKEGKLYSDDLWKRLSSFMEKSLNKDSAKKHLGFSGSNHPDAD